MSTSAKQITSESPNLSEWLVASNDQLVVAAFVADWAGGAMILRGFLAKVARQFPSIAVHYVEVEDYPELSAEMGVNTIPTVVLLRNQTVVDHIDGVIPRSKLAARIEPHI